MPVDAFVFPASIAQSQLWLLDQLDPGSPLYNLPQALELTGPLEPSILRDALDAMVVRHESLRTTFSSEAGAPLQVIAERAAPIELPLIDLRALARVERDAEASRLIVAEARRPFDLSAGPLLRAQLLRLDDERHILLVAMHHIVADGWSLAVFVQELASLYDAFHRRRPSPLPDLPIQYVDYAEWQRERMSGEALDSHLAYWRAQLAGVPALLALPTDRPRPSSQSFCGAIERRVLPVDLTRRIRELARRENVTAAMVLHAGFQMLLARESGQRDFVLGFVSAGRERPETERVIGLLANTVVVRADLRDDPTGRTLLSRVREATLDALAHQDVPFQELVAAVNPQRTMGHHPLFQVMFVSGELRDEAVRAGALTLRPLPIDGGTAKFDLTLNIAEGTEAVTLALEYCTDLFEAATSRRLSSDLERILSALADEPERAVSEIAPPRQRPPAITDDSRQVHGLEPSSRVFAGRAATAATERVVTQIWSDVLQTPSGRLRPDDNFFELGGHSLMAARVMARIRDRLGVDLPLRAIFEAPTIRALAASIDAETAGEPRHDAAPPLSPVSRGTPQPLSIAQEQIWFLEQLHPGQHLYNVPEVLRLDGPLDAPALERSFAALARRHEALRTSFVNAEDGTPRQTVAASVNIRLRTVDLSGAADAERECAAHVEEEIRRPFDLSRPPLLRALLVRQGPEAHVLVITMHHLVTDAWSASVLLRDLSLFYGAHVSGATADLPARPIQHVDYASWQREWVESDAAAPRRDYWVRALSGTQTVTLPADRPRPPVRSIDGGKHAMSLTAELSRAVADLAARLGCTPFMVLLAAFKALLARATGQTDIVVGTDVANRDRQEIEGVVGLFVDNLVLRTDLSGDPTMPELVGRVRESTLAAFAHQLPFGAVLAAVRPERNLGQTPLFQALFVLQNAPAGELTLPGLTIGRVPIDNRTSKFDLALFITQESDRYEGVWVYRTDLFDAATVARAAGQFAALLAEAVRQSETRLSQLSLLTDEERSRRAMEDIERQQSTLSRLKGARRKAVNLAEVGSVKTALLRQDQTLPLLIEPESGDLNLMEWARGQRGFIEASLVKHGALLFRNFGLRSLADFEAFVQGICPELFEEYGDLPREGASGRIYKSTPYPADRPILFHNESSHLHQWPLKIWFHCVTPAAEGGETPIVDCREVYRRLDPAVRDRFAARQLMYVRNYTEGLDVSWQDFFHTSDRRVVEDYCRRASMTCEWKGDNGLRTREICPAVVRHPATGELSFFNQIQLHHVSCLEPAVRDSLLAMFPEEDLPRNVYYGDGTPIEDSLVQDITNLYWETSVAPVWQAGDVMMLDNMLTAHARNPFSGERKIVVAMGELVHKEQVAGAQPTSA